METTARCILSLHWEIFPELRPESQLQLPHTILFKQIKGDARSTCFYPKPRASNRGYASFYALESSRTHKQPSVQAAIRSMLSAHEPV